MKNGICKDMSKKNYIDSCRALVIFGLAKNVGKTTTLNNILQNIPKEKTVAITSIGVDGEDIDVVTGTDKPAVFVRRGSIIATTRGFLRFCDFTKEILDVTDFSTPVGDVVILKCLSDGYARIAGPSIGSQVEILISMLSKLGADEILIDGALDRRTFINSKFVKGCVLATGASISMDLDKVVDLTGLVADFLCLEPLEDESIKATFEGLEDASMMGLSREHEFLFEDDLLNIDAVKNIDLFDKNGGFLLLKGAITDSFMKRLLIMRRSFSNILILIEDGTKLLINKESYDFLIRKLVKIKVIEKIDLRCITINPVAPSGYKFNSKEFINKLKRRTNVPVFDVLDGERVVLPI